MSLTVVHTETGPSGLDLNDSHHASIHSQLDESFRGSRSHRSLTREQISGQMSFENSHELQRESLSRASAVILTTTLTGITFVGSMSGGLLTIGLPWIAADLDLPDNLLLW